MSQTEAEYFGEGDSSPMAPEPGKVIVVIEGVYLHETSKAVLLKCAALTGEFVDVWLPKSQFKRDFIPTAGEDDEVTIATFVPTWLAEAKEVEYRSYDPEDWKGCAEGSEAAAAGQLELPLNKFE